MSDEEQRNGADVGLEIAGQKVNLKNVKSLNTLATVAALIGVLLLLYMMFSHTQDSRDDRKEFVQAVREQTTAVKESTDVQREANCFQMFKDAERCRRIR